MRSIKTNNPKLTETSRRHSCVSCLVDFMLCFVMSLVLCFVCNWNRLSTTEIYSVTWRERINHRCVSRAAAQTRCSLWIWMKRKRNLRRMFEINKQKMSFYANDFWIVFHIFMKPFFTHAFTTDKPKTHILAVSSDKQFVFFFLDSIQNNAENTANAKCLLSFAKF